MTFQCTSMYYKFFLLFLFLFSWKYHALIVDNSSINQTLEIDITIELLRVGLYVVTKLWIFMQIYTFMSGKQVKNCFCILEYPANDKNSQQNFCQN